MGAKVYCKVTGKGILSFYLQANGEEYFLFNQKYRVSLKDYFMYGVALNEIFTLSKNEGYSITKVKTKIPSYIHYIESEYEITVLNKSKKSSKGAKKSIRACCKRCYDKMEKLTYDAQMIA